MGEWEGWGGGTNGAVHGQLWGWFACQPAGPPTHPFHHHLQGLDAGDSELREYTHGALSNIAALVGPGVAPLLPRVVPAAAASLAADDGGAAPDSDADGSEADGDESIGESDGSDAESDDSDALAVRTGARGRGGVGARGRGCRAPPPPSRAPASPLPPRPTPTPTPCQAFWTKKWRLPMLWGRTPLPRAPPLPPMPPPPSPPCAPRLDTTTTTCGRRRTAPWGSWPRQRAGAVAAPKGVLGRPTTRRRRRRRGRCCPC